LGENQKRAQPLTAKAASCYWKEIFLDLEVSKGPKWFRMGCASISELVVEVEQELRLTI
jgi:hypothetical protein